MNYQKNLQENLKILIVDDEELIHDNLEMNLRDLKYDDKNVAFLHAKSASEAKKIIESDSNIAVAILDVMMEEDTSGLEFVRFIRDELKNEDIRILLHTGQPGIAPKKEIANRYKIDAYLDKNTTDNEDAYAAAAVAIRAYQERLKLKAKSAKTDIELLSEIAQNYFDIFQSKNFQDKVYKEQDHEELLSTVSSMVNLSQEILAAYAMTDLKQNLALGTTKSSRFSFDDYSALIQLHNLKIILMQISLDRLEKEKTIIFDIINNGAEKFANIAILPDLWKDKIKAALCGKF